jgi:hypothetical protein
LRGNACSRAVKALHAHQPPRPRLKRKSALVPQTSTTIFDELQQAARGVAAIVLGDRKAPQYFDFSLRGLTGSFIAFIIAATADAYLPLLTGADAGDTPLAPSLKLLISALLFGVQTGAALLVLRRMKRPDGFVPYLVADNWASFYVTAASTILKLVGVSDMVGLIFFGLILLVVEINTGRLIVTLSPKQIAIFLITQTIAVSIGYFVLAALFLPMPPAPVVTPG